MNIVKAIFILLTCINLSAQIDGEQLFDDSFLHEIRLENIDTMHFLDTKEYQLVKIIIDGMTIDSIGIKRKGNISGYSNPNKYGIKIKTNKYVDGREFDGIREFTLHMNYQDPTMIREKLTYDICNSMGLFSLRTAFTKVFINNTYWGLYTLVEGKDEMYKHIFNDRNLDAIESLDFGNMCFISTTPSVYDYDNNGNIPRYQLENGSTETAWLNFATMIEKANNTSDEQYLDTVSNYLNLEDFFTYQAVNVYLMNMDSYIQFRGNQIYVYDKLKNIWQVTPWDFNASFGLWDTNNTSADSYPMIPDAIKFGCIADRINNIPQLNTYYLKAMCHLNNTIGDTTFYFDKIDFWKDQIKEAVYSDYRKHITNLDFDNGFEYGHYSIFGESIPSLKTFITERLTLINEELSNINYSCETVDINEINKNKSITILPNPSHNYIIYDINKELSQSSEIFIHDSLGKVIHYWMSSQNQIDIEHLPHGLYILTIVDNTEIYTGRFIKR